VSGDRDVVATNERGDERRHVGLSAPRFGERYEQKDPRVLRHRNGRERYRGCA
jgi:hypothetical protein